jgi:hypothetical protein
MRGDRAPMHPESVCQFGLRGALLILGHQLVDLIGRQQPLHRV